MYSAPKKRKFRIKYKPRKWQARLHKLAKTRRFVILNFHRRAGKSYWALAELLDTLLKFDKIDPETNEPYRNPKGAVLASTIGQAERTFWLYLKDLLEEIPNVKFNATKNRVTFPHPDPRFGLCTIQLWGAQDIDAIRGDYLDAAVLDEFAILPPDLYSKVILPMLVDRQGKMIIISTPQGTNSFYKLYQVAKSKPHIWIAETMNVHDTEIIPEEDLDIIRETSTEDAWNQEFLCDFHAVPEGMYFGKEMMALDDTGAISDFPWDGQSLVHTSWDIGMDDSTCIAFFVKRGDATIYIDYEEDRGKGLDHYVKLIKDKGYNYGKHFFPHDITTRELSTGRDRLSYLHEYGLTDIIVVPKTSNLPEVIHLVRQFLPTARFDERKCNRLVECLKAYQRKYDPKTDTFGDKPLRNFATHGVDALRTYVQVAGLNYLNENPFIENEQYAITADGFDPFEDIGVTNVRSSRNRDFFRSFQRQGNRLLR